MGLLDEALDQIRKSSRPVWGPLATIVLLVIIIEAGSLRNTKKPETSEPSIDYFQRMPDKLRTEGDLMLGRGYYGQEVLRAIRPPGEKEYLKVGEPEALRTYYFSFLK